jgi:YebC/PmpR family DNA-binding regulatory protein
MSGHSKWAQIKRQKGVTDTRRGQLFTKLTREIIVAARQGGANPEANFRLRLVVQKARDNNMPLENIDRAIKRGSGGLESSSLTELNLEGYGPSGVAVMVETLTDNRNRTLSDVRNVFSKHGGNMGEAGCVAWIFESKGVITVDTSDSDAEELALLAIDAGANDVKIEEGYLEVYTTPQNLEDVRKAIEQVKPILSAEVSLLPNNTVMVDEKGALQTLKLLDHLEELDDVQKVFSNVDYNEAVLEKLRSQA